MTDAAKLFYEIGNQIPEVKAGNMFGWPCFKFQRKPFLFFDKNSEDAMVFKVNSEDLQTVLAMEGASIFNPGDKGKPMKNWVVVPFAHHSLWLELAIKSYEHIQKEVNYGK